MGARHSTSFLLAPHGPDGFKAIARKRRYKIKYPTSVQKKAHIDLLLAGLDAQKKTLIVSMDIKYLSPGKKISTKWQWLELRDDRGRPGWIYKEGDFIVFERKADFMVVNRKNLVEWINVTSKIRYDLPRVKNSWQAKYRLFQRPGKKDVITQVQSNDLLKIAGTAVWNKEDG